MDASASEFHAQDNDLARRDARNWACSIGIVAMVMGLSVYSLAALPSAPPTTIGTMSSAMMLAYNACVAACGAAVQLHLYLDPTRMELRHKVPGRPEIPTVIREFSGCGKWVMFTNWSNTLGVAYFCLALAVGVLQRGQWHVPYSLARATGVLWEIVFPMSFFTNFVVTFVLIPGWRKAGDIDKVHKCLEWISQAKHNGFVLAASVEAALASPPMQLADVPLVALYVSCYVLFSFFLFQRLQVFCYFFLDPRFKFAPCAQLLLTSVILAFCGLCCAVSTATAERWVLRPVIVLAALATCTFREAGAKARAPGAAEDETAGA